MAAMGIQRTTQDSARIVGALSGAGLVAALGATPVLAHHGWGSYDAAKPLTITGPALTASRSLTVSGDAPAGQDVTVSERAAVLGKATADDIEAAIERRGVSARTLSAFVMPQVCELFTRATAHRYLAERRIVLLGAGTGNPFFTTDTAAALRGAEIGAELVLKATKVDGVYSADPKKDPQATRYAKISFDDAIRQNLGIMDATAFALCRDQKLPIKVFSIFKNGALKRVVMGEDEGTLVYA